MKEKSTVNIEKEAINHLEQIRGECGLTETQWGEKAFPYVKNKRIKISALKTPRKNTGEPLRLRLGDFCALCHALGRNPAQELLLIWAKADTSEE